MQKIEFNADISPALRERLLLQSIVGQAHNGHAGFKDQSEFTKDTYVFPNATFYEIANALRTNPNVRRQSYFNMNPRKILSYTQDLIDADRKYTLELLLDVESENRINFDRNKTIAALRVHPIRGDFYDSILHDNADFIDKHSIKRFLMGKYLASKMDSFEWRQRAEVLFNNFIRGPDEKRVNYHKGEVLPINLKNLRSERTANHVSLNISDFSNGVYKHKLGLEDASPYEINRYMTRIGLVHPRSVVMSDDFRPVYVEYEKGTGTSDDVAILMAGELHGLFGFLGAENMDLIDTLEKFTTNIIRGGTDEQFGEDIKTTWENYIQEDFPVPDSEVLLHILSCRKEKHKCSSSQRYFWQKDATSQKCTIDNHIRLLGHYRGILQAPNGNETVGFTRRPYSELRKSLEGILEEYKRKKLIVRSISTRNLLEGQINFDRLRHTF